MNPHKNMKQVTKRISPYELEGDPKGILEYLESESDGLIDVQLSWEWEDCFELSGWRPMTEKELVDAKKERTATRLANKAEKEKKEASERAEYERLKKKFEGEGKDQ